MVTKSITCTCHNGKQTVTLCVKVSYFQMLKCRSHYNTLKWSKVGYILLSKFSGSDTYQFEFANY